MKKKNLFKVGGLVLLMPLALAGCATVSGVIDPATGKSAYFEDITYFGGSAAKIGDYLYYGNTYTSVSGDAFNYNSAKKTGYMARVDLTKGFTTDGKGPSKVEKANDKLAGYDNQNMFAFQSYLYFTSANTHKTGSLENDYSRVSVFRMKFNGDDVQELFTTKYSTSSFISAVEGSDGNSYIVTYAEGEKTGTNDISVMKIGDKLGKNKVIVENATSAVVDKNIESKDKNIYYSKASTIGANTTEVFSLDLANNESEKITISDFGSTTKLLAKVDDELFYSYNRPADEIYKAKLDGSDITIGYRNDFFYATSSISDVYKVGKGTSSEGYVFKGSDSLMYQSALTKDTVKIISNSNFSNILFVDGDFIYFSNSSSIGRVSFKKTTSGEYKIETLAQMSGTVSGKYAFIDGYIYFYATYSPVAEFDEDGEEIKYESDETVYMYRIKAGSTEDIGKPELVSKNKERKVVESEEE